MSDFLNELFIKETMSALKSRGPVSGGIKPSGTFEITDNGEYDITNYEKVKREV